MEYGSLLHLHEETLQQAVVARKVPPLDVLLPWQTALDVDHPVLQEVEEGQSTTSKPLPPSLLPQDITQRDVFALDLLVSRQPFVKVLLPIEQLTEDVGASRW